MSKRFILGVWTLLAFLMSLNGAFREAVLAKRFPRPVADALSAALGIAIILGVTRTCFRAFKGNGDARPARIALVWTGLTVAFEFIFGHYADRKSWRELAANYAIWRGRLWPVVLLSLVASPFLWGRRRRPKAPVLRP